MIIRLSSISRINIVMIVRLSSISRISIGIIVRISIGIIEQVRQVSVDD